MKKPLEKPNFLIYSLGCKVNQYDSSSLRHKLENIGFNYNNNNPGLVIINTCSVTKSAITKDRQLYNKLSKKFPQCKFVIMGCWPQTDTEAKDSKSFLNKKDIYFWGVGEHNQLINEIISLFPECEFKLENKDKSNLVSTDKSRYFLKIGDGCNQFCSYCIIPYARGRLKSRSSKKLINEVKEASNKGFKEIVLSGIHLGQYGYDKKGKELNLTELLKELLKIDNKIRFRLSSIEVNEVSDELIELMSTEKQICPHLHISLQSGSNKILKLMNRPYKTKIFKERIEKLRKSLPDIAITTDIIVGFPGETNKDFQESYDFAKEIKFSKVHVFSYSAHEKTASYNFPNKVSVKDIKERSKMLRELSDKLETEYKKKILNIYKNKNLEVIVEKKGEKIKGVTKYSFSLEFNNKYLKNTKRKIKTGDLVDVNLNKDICC
ncbi:MAG: tRNA (N(6)-L-threonylcarbamoyladenosine(37)-C(2))-methylthiotransferase MtaB [Patescibacteria group bacterium]|jgi:threonylcarbamoyladenosine tRNA methylthiotransferase MtaB|nr:tRNA (N(6)-L-threonylcarbamoyladenosine(37)-C(2))-methylthiotransferase MtaB [Patescibacteria group bacterium]